MTPTVHPIPAALRDACAAAQAQASRFHGDQPALPWSAAGRTGPRPRRGALVLAGAALLGVLATAAAVSSTPTPGAVEPRIVAAPPTPQATDAEEAPVQTNSHEERVSPPPASPPPLLVARAGRQWVIESQGASRHEAALALARAQGTSLEGDAALLRHARPLTLRWTGPDAVTAWRLLLGDEVSYALRCSADRCRPFIVASASVAAVPSVASAVVVGTPLPAGVAAANVPDNAAQAPPPRSRIDPPDDGADVFSRHD